MIGLARFEVLAGWVVLTDVVYVGGSGRKGPAVLWKRHLRE